MRTAIIFAIVLIFLSVANDALAAPNITVSATAQSILGTSQTISLTCTLLDFQNTGMLRSGGQVITGFTTSTTTPGTTATCGPLFGNDAITDGFGNINTTGYKVQVFTVSGGIVASTPSLQQFYAFTGSGTIDLATATPLAPSFFTGPSGNVVMPGTLGVTGNTSLSTLSTSGTDNANGDLLAKSGRPWYDVMAFGAKNDGVTDDTAAIQAAITAACATTPPGGIIYFPPGKGYKTANTSVAPFTISCNNLTFKGVAWGQTDTPLPPSAITGTALTAPMFVTSGNPSGFRIEDLYLQGNLANSGAVAIHGTGSSSGTIFHDFFDQWGGQCILTDSGTPSWWITDNWAQNCLGQKAGLVADTGAFDLANNDLELHNNFVTASAGLGAGNIGTGHAYAYVLRGGCCGFITDNMGEISQHGWLITGSYMSIIGNRAVLNQGNGFHVTGSNNIINSNKSLTNSQTANNSFDGFLCDGTCSRNIFSNNLIDDTAGGNGNHTRNGFTDANSNGPSTGIVGNHYSNNLLSDGGALGVLYNFTGSAPYSVQQPMRPSADQGDTSPTIQCAVDAQTQYFNTVLTANRTVTLSTAGAWNGCKFRVIRTASATGAFTLTVNSLALYPGNSADFEFIAGAWKTVAPNNPIVVAHGTQALNTASVTTATCDGGLAVTANGALSTDTVDVTYNAAPSATNKYGAFLNVVGVPSANTVTLYTCNPSATTSTPTAMTVNWSVRRP